MLGVAGFIIFKNDKDHESNNFEAAFIKTIQMNEKNNVRTEIKGVLLALQMSNTQVVATTTVGNSEIVLFTDCRSILNLIDRRAFLEANEYISRKSNSILANADLYKDFFKLFDVLRPKIIWVKGHSPQREYNPFQENFSFIDRLVRKELREALK